MSFSMVGVSGDGATLVVNSEDFPQPPPTPNFPNNNSQSSDVCLLYYYFIFAYYCRIWNYILTYTFFSPIKANLHYHTIQQFFEYIIFRQQLQLNINNHNSPWIFNFFKSFLEPISFSFYLFHLHTFVCACVRLLSTTVVFSVVHTIRVVRLCHTPTQHIPTIIHLLFTQIPFIYNILYHTTHDVNCICLFRATNVCCISCCTVFILFYFIFTIQIHASILTSVTISKYAPAPEPPVEDVPAINAYNPSLAVINNNLVNKNKRTWETPSMATAAAIRKKRKQNFFEEEEATCAKCHYRRKCILICQS